MEGCRSHSELDPKPEVERRDTVYSGNLLSTSFVHPHGILYFFVVLNKCNFLYSQTLLRKTLAYFTAPVTKGEVAE